MFILSFEANKFYIEFESGAGRNDWGSSGGSVGVIRGTGEHDSLSEG